MKTCLQEKYGLFINGQWQPASDGKTFKSYNPANGRTTGRVCTGDRCRS